jgi:hypothetical protein
MISLSIGVVQLVGLTRWARLPESSGARLAAMTTLGLHASSVLLDGKVLAARLAGQGGFGFTATSEALAGSVLSLACFLALVTSLERAGDREVVDRGRPLKKLLGWIAGSVLAIAALLPLHTGFVYLAVIPAIGVLVALVRLFGVLGATRAAIARRG